MQATGIGTALRKARLILGKSIEEVSRETRIRAEYLMALERERFETLLGDAYVRGFLRSYSSYLGLDADKVLTIYNRHFTRTGAPGRRLSWPSPPGRPRYEPPTPVPRPLSRRSWHPTGAHVSWRVVTGIAALAVAALTAVGLLSLSRSGSPPAEVSEPRASIPVLPPTVSVGIRATAPVHAVVRSDGVVVFDAVLRRAESRSFRGTSRIDVELAQGNAAALTWNGRSIRLPTDGQGYSVSFRPNGWGRTSSESSR